MRAPVAEGFSTVAVCATMGEEDQVKRYEGEALPTVMERFGRLGRPVSEKALNLWAMAAGHTARSREVLHVWARPDAPSALVCDSGCGLAGAGQGSGPGGASERGCLCVCTQTACFFFFARALGL